ncbi:MAG: stage III sporulation protein AF [Clostridiales bacterium]|jgi:stage III sporulation protein AF|nr:stage III sporulation protein AF [Clostridiales bacterium]
MSYISHWLRNLSYFLIFFAFAGIILPSEKYKKYINLCMGIVLIVIMMEPIARLFSIQEIPIYEFFAGLAQESLPSESPPYSRSSSSDSSSISGFDDAQNPYDEMQRQLIKQSFDAQAKSQVSRMIEKEGFEVASVEVSSSPDLSSITGIDAVVRRKLASGKRPFIYVEPVKPRIGAVEESGEPEEIKRIKNTISDFYNMSADNINISEIN